jgi:hypothetical protein
MKLSMHLAGPIAARRILSWAVSHVLGALLACSAAAAPATTIADDHVEALGALANLRAAIDDIQGAHGDLLSGAAGAGGDCAHAAHRAINELAGPASAEYRESDGLGGDTVGALVHLERLTAENSAAPWSEPIAHARDHASAAIPHLLHAEACDETSRRELTAALAELTAAVGRGSELGPLGGISGALATTVLGVPTSAKMLPACETPQDFPSYGVAAGYLVFVALPLQQGKARLPADLGSTLILTSGDHVIVYTAAEALRPALCGPVGNG